MRCVDDAKKAERDRQYEYWRYKSGGKLTREEFDAFRQREEEERAEAAARWKNRPLKTMVAGFLGTVLLWAILIPIILLVLIILSLIIFSGVPVPFGGRGGP
jgi:hypothetical protein